MLSIESLLDRFGQSNNFRKWSTKKFRDIQQMTQQRPKNVFWRSSRGRPENVLGTSRISLAGTSPGYQIRTSSGHHFRTSLGRHFETSPGLSNRIFRGSPGGVEGGRSRDVLGTNICRLGSGYKVNVIVPIGGVLIITLLEML